MINRYLCALFFSFLVYSPARADEVVLSNGDRLSGRVVRKFEAILTLATDYAGEVKIQWQNIASLKTEKPVEVLLVHGDDLEHTRLEAGDVDWERRPAAGRKPTDAALLFGMGYEW